MSLGLATSDGQRIYLAIESEGLQGPSASPGFHSKILKLQAQPQFVVLVTGGLQHWRDVAQNYSPQVSIEHARDEVVRLLNACMRLEHQAFGLLCGFHNCQPMCYRIDRPQGACATTWEQECLINEVQAIGCEKYAAGARDEAEEAIRNGKDRERALREAIGRCIPADCLRAPVESLIMKLVYHIDFRFAEIAYELSVLDEYLHIIKVQLPGIQDRLWTAHREQICNLDPIDADLETQERKDVIEKALPRLLLNPFIVALWATFESAVVDIAGYLQKQKGRPFCIDDIRYSFSLSRAKCYLEQGLGFSFIDKQESAWQHLRRVDDLRNAIAHANGRLEAVADKSRSKIIGWEKDSGIAIKTDGRYVYLTMDFLSESHRIVKEVLEDLMQRSKAEVRGGKAS